MLILMDNNKTNRPALFADTVARPMVLGGYALMSKQSTGLAASARFFSSLEAILSSYRVRLGETGEDRHGPFVRIVRAS